MSCLHPDACPGDRSTYNNEGCRGEACRAANAADRRARKRAVARPDAVPTPLSVPTGQLRTHIRELREHGIGMKTIAAVSGVSGFALRRIMRDPKARVRPETKAAIMAVTPAHASAYLLVPAAETLDGIDLLRGAGWSEVRLARLVHGADTRRRVLQIGDRVRRRTAERVRAAVDAEFPPELVPTSLDPLALFRSALIDNAWKADAECRRLDGDVKKRQKPFFPTRGEVDLSFAKSVCDACPVVEPCLHAALVNDEQGVWGGTTGDDRRDILAAGLSAAEVIALRASAPDVRLADLLVDVLAKRSSAA